MNREITLELLSAVNPAPLPDRLPDSLGIADDALLQLIEQRSETMSTHTEHQYTRDVPDLDGDTQRQRVAASRRGWRIAIAAFAIVLLAGVAAAILSLAAPSSPATAEFGLVGGEDVNDFDDNFGWSFEGLDLISIRSPGPTLEVEVGTEVTVAFTNVSGWSNTDPADAIRQSFRIVPTIPSPDTLFGADTGLVDVGETATITFVADQVGEFRYVSDGLGMAPRRGMFGRFIVVEAGQPDSQVVGTWSSLDTTLALNADGTFAFTNFRGSTSGRYVFEAGPTPTLVMWTSESTIPDDEFGGEPCMGRDALIVGELDEGRLSIALDNDDHRCGYWPSFATLTPTP